MYRACVSVLKKTVRQEHNLKSHDYILRNLFRTNTINKMEIASPQSFDGGKFIRTVKEYLKIRGRCLHTSQPAMTHLLSVEEIFRKKSLQDYLNKLETEHRDCLKIVNLPPGEDSCGDLKMRSTRVAQLAPLVECVKQLELKQKELEEIEVLLKEDDPDIGDLAEAERVSCQEGIQDLKKKILSHLVPPEKADESNLVLEVTAGIGGQEAMLFTAELFNMYQNFATFQGWDFEVLDYMPSEIGGLRHACASVSGPKSYQKMKFEGGVHRVQRVPKTEKQGRMHTSTTTVAVLPQPTEITLNINTKDLRIETKRASGAGGQHVNTTDSAVRIVHIPTGVAAECQQERSQLRNKDKAMQVLRAKLYGLRLEEEASKVKQARKIQIGTRARSEKIRTYNFSQDRVTDHRIGKSLHDLKEFMLGEDLLEEMSRSLQQLSEQEALMDILDEVN